MSVLVIAGCGAREPVEAPPAATASGYGAAQTPELMGAPPAAEATPADGLLGGPAPAEAPAAAPAPAPVFTSNPNLKTWRRADGTLVTAMAPIANPKQTRYAPRAVSAPTRRAHAAPAPVAKPAAKPVTVATAPAPVKPVVAAKPAVAPAKAPVVAAAAAAVAKPAPPKPLTKLEKLQAAVAPEATKGATLATAESLTQGKEGQVTLSLPATLGDLIKREAAKLGLTKAAKKTSAYADLQGQGYEITPNGRQTAEVKTGEPATFAWQVKPTPDAKGPLKTDFGVELDGTKPTQGFTLGSIAKQVAPIQEAVKEKTKGFKFAMPDLGRYETVDLPGVGKVPGKSLLGGALVLLALLILVAIARNASASKARAERRRKFRTLTDYGRNEMEHDEPLQSAKVNYVNPMVAAAGGALAGAAVVSAINHHDDHGHADHGHGHDAHADHGAGHGHEDHGHAHGHEDHGHGHDDHGHDAHHVKAVTASGHDHADAHAGDHHEEHGHGHGGHDDHHVAPTAGAEALAVSGHDHAGGHHDDHGHDAHGHGHDSHDDHGHGHAEAGHHDDHGHNAHADHKELAHAH